MMPETLDFETRVEITRWGGDWVGLYRYRIYALSEDKYKTFYSFSVGSLDLTWPF